MAISISYTYPKEFSFSLHILCMTPASQQLLQNDMRNTNL